MEFKKETLETLIKRIQEKSNNHQCPVCNNTQFRFTDSEYHLVSFKRDSATLFLKNQDEITFIPLLACFCNNCGHVELFSPTILGVTID